jgi:hypothetical protein
MAGFCWLRKTHEETEEHEGGDLLHVASMTGLLAPLVAKPPEFMFPVPASSTQTAALSFMFRTK